MDDSPTDAGATIESMGPAQRLGLGLLCWLAAVTAFALVRENPDSAILSVLAAAGGMWLVHAHRPKMWEAAKARAGYSARLALKLALGVPSAAAKLVAESHEGEPDTQAHPDVVVEPAVEAPAPKVPAPPRPAKTRRRRTNAPDAHPVATAPAAANPLGPNPLKPTPPSPTGRRVGYRPDGSAYTY